MTKKYSTVHHSFSPWVDYPTKEIEEIVKTDSASLERQDLKDIILELCWRLKEAKSY